MVNGLLPVIPVMLLSIAYSARWYRLNEIVRTTVALIIGGQTPRQKPHRPFDASLTVDVNVVS